MHPHSLFIGMALVLFTIFFGVLAWTGRISFGRWTLLDRRTDPKRFWIVFVAYLALVIWGMKDIPDMLDRVAAMNAKLKQRSASPE
jgi:hypothetical protein